MFGTSCISTSACGWLSGSGTFTAAIFLRCSGRTSAGDIPGCYEDQLVPLNWQAGHHIKWLMDWIERHADKGELEKWRIRAASMDDPGHAAAGVISSWRSAARGYSNTAVQSNYGCVGASGICRGLPGWQDAHSILRRS